jgi:hypothetical protein
LIFLGGVPVPEAHVVDDRTQQSDRPGRKVLTRADGRVIVSGLLEDKSDDGKGALVIFYSKSGQERDTANLNGPHQTVPFIKNYPETVGDLEVRECLTDQERAAKRLECSEPLMIWPPRSPQ